MKLKYILLSLALIGAQNVCANDNISNDTLPFNYQRFVTQSGIEQIKGEPNAQGLSFNLYRVKNKYFMEIPKKALNRDVLVTMQEMQGYSGYVSNQSGIIRFDKGNDKHTLFMRRNRSIDVQNDSTDANMMEALRMSNLQPIDMAFTVVSEGEKGKSFIIDITQDVNSPRGLFDVSQNYKLNNPDARRSHITAMRGIDGGIAIQLYRSQNGMMNNTMTSKVEVSYTTNLQFVIQVLPERKSTAKLSNPFYGFETFSRQEYDTKTYVSRRREYISRWNLKSNSQIIVYLSPKIPAPFVAAVKKAFTQWAEPLAEVGYKQPFRFTSDDKEATLSYNHIYVDWNGINVEHKSVSDELSGEIVSSLISLNDAFVNDNKLRYFTLCRMNDSRVSKDLINLNFRCDMVEAAVASEIGRVLGLKPNTSGNTCFSPQQLRSKQWVARNGCSASVTDNLVFNYVAQPGDNIKGSDLFPKVSVYDREAIAYAYGKREKVPSLPLSYYVAVDEKHKSYRPSFRLSDNCLEASKLGIANIRRGYETLHKDMFKLPAEQNDFKREHALLLTALGEYQQMVENIAGIVGSVRVLPVIRGVNDKKNHYASRQNQIDALQFLRSEILHGVQPWIDRADYRQYCEGNISGMTRAIAVSIYKKLMDKDVIASLVDAEDELGKQTFTASELFSFIDHELFSDFDATAAVPEYIRLLQANVIPDLATKVFAADLSLGMGNEGATVLHGYFIHLAEKISYLSEHHADKITRENYKMIKMRLDRQYFNKQH